MISLTLQAANETEMVALGKKLGSCVEGQTTIFLHGDLGAGKTTFSRGVLQSFGHTGPVKSPTYTLVEPYIQGGRHIYHFDLYRLSHPEELEYMGIRDYFSDDSLCLVEWPERGEQILPEPDLIVNIKLFGVGREISLEALSQTGVRSLQKFKQEYSVADI